MQEIFQRPGEFLPPVTDSKSSVKADDFLDFPDGRHFVSNPPLLSLEQMAAINFAAAIEAMKDPGFFEKRRQMAITAEFAL